MEACYIEMSNFNNRLHVNVNGGVVLIDMCVHKERSVT